MIICHKHKFIFIRTRKAASTSIELYLSRYCNENDVLTPIDNKDSERNYQPYNYSGLFNPFPELIAGNGYLIKRTVMDLKRKRKFYHHIPAFVVRSRISDEIWKNYFKFSVERNPWDKTLSHYHYINERQWAGSKTFAQYCEIGNFCWNHPIYTDPKSGKVMVDRILKYENLMDELGQVLEMLDIPFAGSLGSFANSEYRRDRRSYREVFSPDQRDLIYNAFKKEIEIHGYEF